MTVRMSTAMLFFLCVAIPAVAQGPNYAIENEPLSAYFHDATEAIESQSLSEIQTREDWLEHRDRYRRELLEMLGLSPLPERTPLKVTKTGETKLDDIVVENLHFQSRPGLYVTANLYRPAEVTEPLPAVLYVCGHGRVKKDDISYGNKTHYQHHGAWFANNGYVCLTIDTLQLGEIEGIHHGTYRYDRWWWLNRGYTPAGVEAWNCVRALDLLESRDEVDIERVGVTGRSGGGAYSWWIAAIDDRIRCAVPVAGITDLRNHVVDGCVEGHCDCMFMVNTYRWDYAKVAALVAPRPLLISNTDTDRIFPLDGVYRTYRSVRRIYDLLGAGNKVALNTTAGGHKDTQELRVHAFRWMNHHLKSDDGLIRSPAEKLFEVEQLRVLTATPEDEQNTSIDESFVAAAVERNVDSAESWTALRDDIKTQLDEKCFRGWPEVTGSPVTEKVFDRSGDGVRLQAYDFESQPGVGLRLYIAHRDGLERADLIVLNALDEQDWGEFAATYAETFPKAFSASPDQPVAADEEAFGEVRQMFQSFDWAMAYVAPRGIGPTAWDDSKKKRTQIRRRFYLLGQTLDGMRVFDIRRAVQSLRQVAPFAETQLWLQANRAMAGNALYASLYEPKIHRIDLHELPRQHRSGPYYLNVSRITTIPTTVAMAAERAKVVIYDDEVDAWAFPREVAGRLGREGAVQIRKAMK